MLLQRLVVWSKDKLNRNESNDIFEGRVYAVRHLIQNLTDNNMCRAILDLAFLFLETSHGVEC